MIGELITPIIFTKFIPDETTKIITETTVTLHGRRISLTDIRMELLNDQEQLGVVRLSDDENLSENEVENAIIVRKISLDATHTTKTMLKKAKQVRHLKVCVVTCNYFLFPVLWFISILFMHEHVLKNQSVLQSLE